MSDRARLNFESLVSFAVAGILFGLVYNALFYPHTWVEYAEAATIGLILGLASSVAEETLLRYWFRRWSLSLALAARTLLYSITVAITLSLVLSIEPATRGECPYLQCLVASLTGPLFLRDLFFTTIFVSLTTFTVQVVFLIGTRNFGRLLLGRYRQPREVYAVFMFADIRGSTAIAERLGHQRFSAFLRDFFTDVSRAIHEARGEVYQYVGDEVVIVWPGIEREGSHWLRCYEGMQMALEKEAAAYQATYGLVPEFKAGVHGGQVIVTEVGTQQRALVYHGDVLNTTARIQSKCNETGFDLLVSQPLMEVVPLERRREFQRVGAVSLRGKTEEVVIYGFDRRSQKTSGLQA